VVVRHEIDYKRPAFLQDAIVARTWVGAAEGLSFERHTEIVRTAGQNAHSQNQDRNKDKLLARARTLWCPVDAETLRPVEPGAEVRARFSTKRKDPLLPEEGRNGEPATSSSIHPSNQTEGV
jgi:acyl-CoA thioester hydrolase